MEEEEGDHIPPEREDQVAQLAKSVSKEEDDISENDVTEEEMSKEEKKLVASMLPKKRRQLYECIS